MDGSVFLSFVPLSLIFVSSVKTSKTSLRKFPIITFNKMTNYATKGTYKYEIRVSVSFARNKYSMLLFSTGVGLRPLCASKNFYYIRTTQQLGIYTSTMEFFKEVLFRGKQWTLAVTAPMRAQRVNGSTVTPKSTHSPFSVSNITAQEYSCSEFSTISASLSFLKMTAFEEKKELIRNNTLQIFY